MLNISTKIDGYTVALFDQLDQVINKLGLPYVVVGATARDLVLHHGYGAEIERATKDVDFAIEVADWAAFEAIKQSLVAQGFTLTKAPQRLIGPKEEIIDIVPFGSIEDPPATISWPPDGKVVMEVLGFHEAVEHAQWVRIRDKPVLDIPVVSPPGLAILKLIAWVDRSSDLRRKDALDLAYLLASYEAIPAIQDAVYDDMQIMEQYGFDQALAAAHFLGGHARSIARDTTQRRIAALARGQLTPLSVERLAEEMCSSYETQIDRRRRLLNAFFSGFGETPQ